MRSLCDDIWAFDIEVLNGMGRDGLFYWAVRVGWNIEGVHKNRLAR